MQKIIDEKGKIFGIVNIVDLFVAIAIIGIIAVLVIKLTGGVGTGDTTSIIKEEKEIYVTLYSNSVVPEVAEILKVGDKLVANNKFTNAEIVSIDVTPSAYITTDQNGEPLLKEHPMWKDISVVIKDTVNTNSPILKAGEQEARVNYGFILKTQQFEANCKVRGIELVDIQAE